MVKFLVCVTRCEMTHCLNWESDWRTDQMVSVIVDWMTE